VGMNDRVKSKVIICVLLGVSVGVYWQSQRQKLIRAGRDAFMAHEAQLWDRSYSYPINVVPLAIVGVGLSVCVFEVYELLVSWVCFLLGKWPPGANSS
jgi:hypothetical protein